MTESMEKIKTTVSSLPLYPDILSDAFKNVTDQVKYDVLKKPRTTVHSIDFPVRLTSYSIPKRMQRLSYISAPRLLRYNYLTLSDIFIENVRRNPEKEIVIHRKPGNYRKSLKYSEFQEKSSKLASFLLKNGISKGDHVGIFGPNSLEWLIAEMGILISGAVAVHLTFDINDSRHIKDYLDNCDCNSLILDPGDNCEFYDVIKAVLSTCSCNVTSKVSKENPLIILMRENEKIHEFPYFEDILERANTEDIEFPIVYPEDTAVVMPTSGSTGNAKWIKHSHFALLNIVDYEILGSNVSLKRYTDRPFSWISGFPVVKICIGCVIVFADARLSLIKESTEVILDIIKDEKCDSAFLSPDFLTDLVYKMDQFLSGKIILHTIVTGGQFLHVLHSKLIGKICNNLVVSYGSTEALLVTLKQISQNPESFEFGNVGKPFGGTEIKIVDENGQVTERGQTGRILCRSRSIFQGYSKREDLTRKDVSFDGWYYSGDIGLITYEDELVLKGREMGVITRGIRSVLPSLVEDIIMEIPSVKQVSAIGVPDIRLHEDLCVCYMTADNQISADDIQRHCKSKLFSDNFEDGVGNLPTYYLCFDEFPTLTNGKINKIELKRLAILRLKERKFNENQRQSKS